VLERRMEGLEVARMGLRRPIEGNAGKSHFANTFRRIGSLI
jgi:hypothetical protein